MGKYLLLQVASAYRRSVSNQASNQSWPRSQTYDLQLYNTQQKPEYNFPGDPLTLREIHRIGPAQSLVSVSNFERYALQSLRRYENQYQRVPDETSQPKFYYS